MAQSANWTNLSETTFLLSPTHPDADYRVRIFTQLTSFCRTSDSWKRIRVGRSIGGVSRCVSILSQRIAPRLFAAKS
nr:PhzF family phenazine biosynthesis protein [Acetobacter senegalensis]